MVAPSSAGDQTCGGVLDRLKPSGRLSWLSVSFLIARQIVSYSLKKKIFNHVMVPSHSASAHERIHPYRRNYVT